MMGDFIYRDLYLSPDFENQFKNDEEFREEFFSGIEKETNGRTEVKNVNKEIKSLYLFDCHGGQKILLTEYYKPKFSGDVTEKNPTEGRTLRFQMYSPDSSYGPFIERRGVSFKYMISGYEANMARELYDDFELAISLGDKKAKDYFLEMTKRMPIYTYKNDNHPFISSANIQCLIDMHERECLESFDLEKTYGIDKKDITFIPNAGLAKGLFNPGATKQIESKENTVVKSEAKANLVNTGKPMQDKQAQKETFLTKAQWNLVKVGEKFVKENNVRRKDGKLMLFNNSLKDKRKALSTWIKILESRGFTKNGSKEKGGRGDD